MFEHKTKLYYLLVENVMIHRVSQLVKNFHLYTQFFLRFFLFIFLFFIFTGKRTIICMEANLMLKKKLNHNRLSLSLCWLLLIEIHPAKNQDEYFFQNFCEDFSRSFQ